MANQKDEAIALDLHNRVTGEELEVFAQKGVECIHFDTESVNVFDFCLCNNICIICHFSNSPMVEIAKNPAVRAKKI